MKRSDIVDAWNAVATEFSNTTHLKTVPSKTLESLGAKSIDDYTYAGVNVYAAPEVISLFRTRSFTKLARTLNIVMSNTLAELVKNNVMTDADAKEFATKRANEIFRPMMELLRNRR